MEFTISETFGASPLALYNAWLDSEKHAGMTGGEAETSDQVGESFTAWDGYIEGENIELDPGKKIVQSWRTSQFPEEQANSVITLIFEAHGAATKLTLKHEQLTSEDDHYKQGWIDHYFTPMKVYFDQ